MSKLSAPGFTLLLCAAAVGMVALTELGLLLYALGTRGPYHEEAPMIIAATRRLACGVMLLGALVPARSLHAQMGVGTWVRQATDSMPAMTMKVEACCGGGRRLIYNIEVNGAQTTLTLDSRFDGSEAPVLIAGKPSGETMAITRTDDHHLSTVVKLNGNPFGTSEATLSPDGRVLKVKNEFSGSVGGQAAGKFNETWVKQ